MDPRIILSKILVLLFKTKEYGISSYNNVIIDTLELIRTDNKEEVVIGKNKTAQLITFILDKVNDEEPLNVNVYLPDIELLLEHDPRLLRQVAERVLKPLPEIETKQLITALVSELNGYTRETKLERLVREMSSTLSFKRDTISNIGEYVRDTITLLEPLASNSTSQVDPAIVREVSFSEENEIISVMEDVIARTSEGGIYISGWISLNKMTQGGFRPGEFVTIGALQHKYKTGLTMSITLQLPRLNEPIMTEADAGKKPLLLRISAEDSMENNFQFMYQYLKANDGEFIDVRKLDQICPVEMGSYLRDKILVNGWHVKFMRVDPSRWTYADIFNTVMKYEAQGYSVKIIVFDYLTMIPTTGCTQGALGADKRDLLRRVRNFMSAKGILFITPLQLSSEAKQLSRNGVPDVALVKEVSEKGYYADSRQLDQEIDLELYCHLAFQSLQNGKEAAYLTIGRGKHRLATVIESEGDRFTILPFPGPNIPVLEDIFGSDTGTKTLPRGGGGGGGFTGGMDDILSAF